jgi:hypothetical protein
MSDDNEPKPPVKLVSPGYGAVWAALDILIQAAREVVAFPDIADQIRILAIALERYDAALAGEIPEPVDLEARWRVRRPGEGTDDGTEKGGTKS